MGSAGYYTGEKFAQILVTNPTRIGSLSLHLGSERIAACPNGTEVGDGWVIDTGRDDYGFGYSGRNNLD